MEFLLVFAIITGALLISFVLINIRHILTGREFRGTCASNNPMIKNNMGDCSVCGKSPEEECQMPQIEVKSR